MKCCVCVFHRKSVFACYKDLGECEEDKEGACVHWLFFTTFSNLFGFCVLVSELLFYFL